MSDGLVLSIAVVGACDAGKSSLSRALTCKEPELEHVSTIGADFMSRYFPERNVHLKIWDLAGMERFQSILFTYIHRCKCILFLYTIDDKQSFTHMTKLYTMYRNGGHLKDKFLAIVATKTDSREYIDHRFRGKNFANNNGLPFFETSSVTKEGVPTLQNALMDWADPPIEREMMYMKVPKKGFIDRCCVIS